MHRRAKGRVHYFFGQKGVSKDEYVNNSITADWDVCDLHYHGHYPDPHESADKRNPGGDFQICDQTGTSGYDLYQHS